MDSNRMRRREATAAEKVAGSQYARTLVANIHSCRTMACFSAASDAHSKFMNTPLMLAVRKDNVDRHNMAFTMLEGAVAGVVNFFSPDRGKLAGTMGAFVVKALGKDPLMAESPYEPTNK